MALMVYGWLRLNCFSVIENKQFYLMAYCLIMYIKLWRSPGVFSRAPFVCSLYGWWAWDCCKTQHLDSVLCWQNPAIRALHNWYYTRGHYSFVKMQIWNREMDVMKLFKIKSREISIYLVGAQSNNSRDSLQILSQYLLGLSSFLMSVLRAGNG